MNATREGTGSGSPAARPPFRYVGGDPSLDLINTVDWAAAGPENERLTDYEALLRWARGVGVLTEPEAERLRAVGRARPDDADAALARARRLRSVLQRLFAGIADGETDAAAWADFNGYLDETLMHLVVAPRAGSEGTKAAANWSWRHADGRLDWLLWPVVRAAARLLTSDEAHRVRVCDGDDCGWTFVDRSRNGLRRWCEMETCGTLAKTRRRRERSRGRARR